ncbi:MAG: cytochrome c2 [Paracoccaceae bacterium]|jgi:cytochrome c2
MKKTLSLTATIAVLAISSIGYASAADMAKGKKVFNKCKACHTLVAGKHRIGPSLAGVFGRTAGTAKKYKFSKAMKKAGKGGLAWDVKTMSAYLVKPRKYVKGTKMTFAGLKKQKDIDNLMAFLKEATK